MRLALVVAVSACGRVNFDVDVDDGLIAHWPMETIEQGVVTDVVGNADGRCTTCPVLVEGVRGGALQFDGTSTIVTMASTPVIEGLSTYSISMWVRPELPQAGVDCMFTKVNAEDGNTWEFCTDDGQLFYSSWDGIDNRNQRTLVSLPDVWSHLFLRWDGTTETLALDGVMIGSAQWPKTSDGGQLVVGADVNFNNPTALFRGAIDDVRIYDRVLSDAAIALVATAD
ncbi:MAG: LamG domain-containing protein [Kofleriaceae bacterium]